MRRTGPPARCRVRGVALRVQLLHRNVQRFRGGRVFKAHRLLYYSTLGLRVIKKKKTDVQATTLSVWRSGCTVSGVQV